MQMLYYDDYMLLYERLWFIRVGYYTACWAVVVPISSKLRIQDEKRSSLAVIFNRNHDSDQAINYSWRPYATIVSIDFSKNPFRFFHLIPICVF